MSYCEWPDFFSSRYPRARKVYKCCECLGPILPKEQYGYHVGKWNGKVKSFRQHLLCEKACVYIRDKFNAGECIGFSDLWEWVRDEGSLGNHKKDPDVREFRKIVAGIKRRQRSDQKSEMTQWYVKHFNKTLAPKKVLQ